MIEELEERIRGLIPEIKELWRSGNKTKSVCLECNIDKAKNFIKLGDQKMIKKMNEVLKVYEL